MCMKSCSAIFRKCTQKSDLHGGLYWHRETCAKLLSITGSAHTAVLLCQQYRQKHKLPSPVLHLKSKIYTLTS